MIVFPHLDFNGNTACNLACVSCSHLAPFTKKEWMPVEVLERDLNNLKPFMHFDRVQAVGGEPTLNPNLVPLLSAARKSGISDAVTVITNGTLLHKMGDDFWASIDVLKLSVYGRLTQGQIDFAVSKCAEKGVLFERQDYPEFYKQFSKEKTDGVDSFTNCFWKNDCHSVHFGKYYRCPQSIFFHKQFSDLHEGEDGLPLEGLTEEKLQAFLNRTEPLKACSRCCGGHGESIKWHESRNREQWVKESTVGI